MNNRDLIVIGGSMGSFDVVKTLCAALPADLPAAVLIVLHLAPDSQNLFAGALDRRGVLPVSTAVDGQEFEKSHIYVAPGDHHLIVVDGKTRLGNGPRENMSRPAIDPLFRSAAINYGPRSVGVVLSGYLNDGAAGLAALKQCGGITVVQNPADAKAPEMPLQALGSTNIDYRCDHDDLAALLVRLVSEPVGAARAIPASLQLEVEIAQGRPCTTELMEKIADPVALSCPSCGGVLSELHDPPLRYRCQVGHSYSGLALAHEKDESADEALRVALRVIEERITLFQRMIGDDMASGRHRSAESWRVRLEEYQRSRDTIRRALLDKG